MEQNHSDVHAMIVHKYRKLYKQICLFFKDSYCIVVQPQMVKSVTN